MKCNSSGGTESKSDNLKENSEKQANNLELANVTIHQVARDGNIQLMEKLLEKYPNPNVRKKKINSGDETKLTPLHYAARYDHYDMLVFLISSNADVHAKDEDESTPLHLIAKHKQKKIADEKQSNGSNGEISTDTDSTRCLKYLVQNGADVNAVDAMKQTPLHHACVRNNIEVVRALLVFSDLRLEVQDAQGLTALHLCCLNGRHNVLQMLLNAGANIRCRDKTNTTPLHFACVEGQVEIVKILLDKADTAAETDIKNSAMTFVNESKGKNGSSSHAKNFEKLLQRKSTKNLFDVELSAKNRATETSLVSPLENSKQGSLDLLQDTDNDKNLPFHLAVESGHLNLVKVLIERAKKAGWNDMVHVRRLLKDSALHLAVQSNNIEIVRLLLNIEIDVNAKNSSLKTPLMIASQHNSYDIVDVLLQRGADVEMKDLDNMTSLMIACRYGHLETIMCLMKHNADVTETDKEDKTCLMWAAEENRAEAVTFLLGNENIQTMIEEKNKRNNTALHLASSKGHNETVAILLEHRASADLKNDDDRTTLHMAALHGHDVIIPALINKDRSILNAGDEDSNTALHLAAIGGNLKCINALINAGSNLEMRNARQWTPLDCAAAHGWEKIAQALLAAGANVQPKGKGQKRSTNQVAPLLLACQKGHVNVVDLLLKWKADVTFRSSDGRNSLDFAIDFGHKDCVLSLIKHETWQTSLKNSVTHSVSGQMLTPMRKLIMKMPDVALIVCNQCVEDNGMKPENDEYAVTFLYEFLDDMYSSTEWTDSSIPLKRKLLENDDGLYAVYNENNRITPEARTYTSSSDELQANHPLQIMVNYQSESVLLHPLLTGLLNHKWRMFGRYVYYTSLLLYLFFLVIMNVYMLLLPLSYKLDWVKIFQLRQFISNNRSAVGLNISNSEQQEFATASTSCLFYRSDVTEDPANGIPPGCFMLRQDQRNLQWVLFVLSILGLLRCVVLMVNQRQNYFTLRNFLETILYVLTLLVSIDFSTYEIQNIELLTARGLLENEFEPMQNFQHETGLRMGWQEEMGAFAVFLSWMVMLLYIQIIPKLGIFVAMFTDILKTFAEFFIVFAFFVIAFALSFHILFGNQHEFQMWYESLLKTTVMTLGELDYRNIFYSAEDEISLGEDYHVQVYTRSVSIVLFTIFMFIMSILISNLLVGLAVGDIIEVQKHATLESLGKQIDLTLQVEFALPSFLRKKLCLRKQVIEVNKYRNANFIKRFLFSPNISLESISKAVDKEEAEQDEARTAEDKVLIGINTLRGRLSDVISEQGELREDVRGVKALVRETKMESKMHADNIKENITETSTNLSGKIDVTRSGLIEKTSDESDQTRDRVRTTTALINNLKEELFQEIKQVNENVEVTTSNLAGKIDSTQSNLAETTLDQSNQTRLRVDGTTALTNQLKEDLDSTKQDIAQIKSDLEEKMELLKQELLAGSWKDLENRIQACHDRVNKTKTEIIDALGDLKILLVKEQSVTRV